MVKLTTDYAPMLDNVTTAHRAAAVDTLADVRGHQAVRTGRLRNSERLVETAFGAGGGRMRISIVSDVVYADAVERGANARVKASVRAGTKRRTTGSKKKGTYQVSEGPLLNRASRRGPHMQGNHVVLDNGPHFLQHMGRRMRERAL